MIIPPATARQSCPVMNFAWLIALSTAATFAGLGHEPALVRDSAKIYLSQFSASFSKKTA
jgi:hypothetical protein